MRPDETFVVVVKAGTNPRRTMQVAKWVRWFVPAALLIVSNVTVPVGDVESAITIDADSIESGPLSVADALTREQKR